jgi:cell division protein FtsQ
VVIIVKNSNKNVKRKKNDFHNQDKYIRKKEAQLKKRKARRKMRRNILLILILISVFITMCLKLSVFNISEIVVTGNKIINEKRIIQQSNLKKNVNIFKTNINNAKKGVESNSYILKAEVKRKMPNKIEINVVERNAEFYAYYNNEYLIVDKYGIVLEKKIDIESMNLVKLEGFDFSKAVVGKKLPCDDERKIELIDKFYDIMKNNKSDIEIVVVDISDTKDIKVQCGSMSLKLGNMNNLIDKLDLAFNILIKKNLLDKKGYVDVSFLGNPVVFIK